MNETHVLEVIFVTLTENSSTHSNKCHPGTSEILTPPKITRDTTLRDTLWTLSSLREGSKTTPVFYLLMEEPLRCFPSLVSLPSGRMVQPENICSCILKVTGQVRESQKKKNSNSYHQRSSL